MRRSPQRRRRRDRAGQPMLASRFYIAAGCHQRRRRTWASAIVRRMIHRRALLETALSAAARLAGRSIVDMPTPDSNARIEALLAAMTLEEKIGQMTLVSAGQAVTGPGGPVDYLQADPRRRGRHRQQSVGPRADPRGAADRARGDAPWHSAALRHGRHPRPPHHLPAAARRGRGVRPGLVGAHGAGRGGRGGRRRRSP